jgi:predicted nucleic acid-binding protein
MLTWWGSKVECASALNRLGREGALDFASTEQALNDLETLSSAWTQIHATDPVQDRALRLLRVHPLRAADALQLAAALIAVDEQPSGFPFACADEQLAAAASKEGFSVIA